MIDRVVWIERGWQPVAIGFCPSEAAWNRARKQYRIEQEYPSIASKGGYTLLASNDVSHESVILVAVTDAAERDALDVILTIVHEAVHVWQFVCQTIGEDAPGNEMEAYGNEEISRGLIEAYCKTQGKDRVWSNA